MAGRLSFMAALAVLGSMSVSAQSFSFNTGDASLDMTLSSLNVQARADIGPYTAELSASFGVTQPQIQAWMTVERLQPAEVYVVLELGRLSGRPPASVIAVYKKIKVKGWGAVARSLGFKPGSPGFKALKSSAEEKNKKLKARKKK